MMITPKRRSNAAHRAGSMRRIFAPFLVVTSTTLIILSGCVTQTATTSPPPLTARPASQTIGVPLAVSPQTSLAAGRSAYEFNDAMIEIPRGFDARDVKHCSQKNAEPWNCLRRKIIRVFVRRNKSSVNRAGGPSKTAALDSIDNVKLSEWLGNMLARTNRFRVVTRDDEIINEEGRIARLTDRREAVAETLRRRRVLSPDFILRVDVTKSAEFVYRASYGDATYHLDLSAVFLDQHTREILSDPVIPDTRVASDPHKYVKVNGRYYAGWDYRSRPNVESVFRDLVSKGFRAGTNALLQSIPSTGKVRTISGMNFTLDRGIESGVLPGETMIIFQDYRGALKPLAVAVVQPGRGQSAGHIVRWKNSTTAESVRDRANRGVLDARRERIFAASVGMPSDYRF